MSCGSGAGQASLAVAPDHPAFAGHFPGTPIVPGVVLLDEALYAIGQSLGIELSACRIDTLKFLSPVGPGAPLSVRYETLGQGALRFEILRDGRKVAIGSVRLPAAGVP
jgi:3-hydroxymyristoyl/3-hydroxydecanoyl-(acyl carrier protein) dehydratase